MLENLVTWFTEPFALSLLRNALYEMLLISVLAGVVGVFIVLRGIAFIVDGLSHAILPGIAVAFVVGGNLFVGAILAALLVTALITFTARNQVVSEDSAIGIFFTGAFALGVIIVSKLQTGGRALSDILFGKLFAVTESDLWQTAIVGGLVVATVIALRKELFLVGFDPNMARALGYRTALLDLVIYLAIALTVVVSLPAVGNILVLAFLITPAATARLLTDRLYPMIFLAIGIAILTGLIGIYISYYANIAGGGAAVVVVGTLIFLIALLLSPKYGAIRLVLAHR
jgi:manganese/iron transport system permease protein